LVDTPPVYVLLVGTELTVVLNSEPIVITWLLVAVLPLASFAVQVLMIVLPLVTSLLVIVTALQLSDAVGLPVTAGSVDAPQLTVTSAISVIVGLVLSTIVITCVLVAVLLDASLAVQVLVIV
jgi:hypothetical protein